MYYKTVIQMSKGVAINFRVDEDSNDFLIKRASQLGISKSAYLCQIINSFEGLEEKATNFDVSSIQIRAKDNELKAAKEQLSYFQTSRLHELFKLNEGKQFKGKTIRTEGDLLRIIVENFEFQQEGNSDSLSIAQSSVTLGKVPASYMVEKVVSFIVVICAAILFYVFFARKAKST